MNNDSEQFSLDNYVSYFAIGKNNDDCETKIKTIDMTFIQKLIIRCSSDYFDNLKLLQSDSE